MQMTGRLNWQHTGAATRSSAIYIHAVAKVPHDTKSYLHIVRYILLGQINHCLELENTAGINIFFL